MEVSDKEKEILQNLEDHVAGQLLDNQFIQTFSSPILSHPQYVITDSESNKEIKYYSAEQMVEMFRAGFLSMSRDDFNAKVFEHNTSKTQSPYHILKQMKVGSTHVFPYTKWRAIRVAASTFKKRFGCQFSVYKISPHNQIGDIKVKRVK